MADLRRIGESIARLLLIAVRSFLFTLLFMLLLGVVLAVVSYQILAESNPVYGLIAAIVALAECVLVGVPLGVKRAIAGALVAGLQKYRIGSTLVQLLFGRLLGVSVEEAHGERGGWLARTAEHLPLAQAEKRIDDALHGLLHAPSEGGSLTGWLHRRVQNQLLASVRKLTLTRFREENAQHGGVDLIKVQRELGEHIDDWLISKFRLGTNLWTVAVLLVLPAQIVVTSYLIVALLK